MVSATPAPTVSVLLPVYNAEKYVRAASESILAQSFEDFELLVIDDGSTDGSLEILTSFKDPRIVLVARQHAGLVPTLNEGLGLVKGPYLARHDADDLSHPRRFEIQVAALVANPRLGVVGSNYSIVDAAGRFEEATSVFTHPDDLRFAQTISNQFGHGSVMIRRSVLAPVGCYDPTVGYVEDYDLLSRLSQRCEVANLSEPLYTWRRNPSGISLSNAALQEEQALRVRDRYFAEVLTHPERFKIYSSWHPSDFHTGWLRYMDKKSRLYRSLSFMFARHGRTRRAWQALLAACLCAPWRKRNWRALGSALTGMALDRAVRYEYV